MDDMPCFSLYISTVTLINCHQSRPFASIMLDVYPIYFLIPFVFLIGISTASFVSMASHRLPREQEIVFMPSYCPKCHTSIKALGLIPLLSWILQKGRCSCCGERISVRYPLIELSLGIVFTGLAFFYGINF